jgi:hypothetical protein
LYQEQAQTKMFIQDLQVQQQSSTLLQRLQQLGKDLQQLQQYRQVQLN